MPYCPECARFATIETIAEKLDVEIDQTTFIASFRIIRRCGVHHGELEDAVVVAIEDVGPMLAQHGREYGHIPHPWFQFGAIRVNARTEGEGRGIKTFFAATSDYIVRCMSCHHVIAKGKALSAEVQSSKFKQRRT